jgi:hypothetical protein
MNLESIQKLWEFDAVINPSDLSGESLKIPKLHSKYYKIFSTERLTLLKYESEYKRLKMLKYDWLDAKLSRDELKDLGWEPCQRTFLKQEIQSRIDSDIDIINMELKIGLQKEKMEFLESIIRSLTNRGYQIRAAIDWERFRSGG